MVFGMNRQKQKTHNRTVVGESLMTVPPFINFRVAAIPALKVSRKWSNQ
jgi:hypothetical protein